MTEPTNLATATAHAAWDAQWRTEQGRAEWSDADPDVLAVIAELKRRGARDALDLGCGVGRHTWPLAAAGLAVHALDASEAGLTHIEAEAERRRLVVLPKQGVMTKLPYADASFDFVLAFNVIYHGDETVVRRAIAEIRRVLRPGGLYQGTMLSKRNERYGRGEQVAANTFVERDAEGDKAHPHFYCNAAELLTLFADFEPWSLTDCAHRTPGSYHWHLLAERRNNMTKR